MESSRLREPYRRFGLIIAWLLLIGVFSVLAPETFPRFSTLAGILGSQAVLVVVSLGLIFPLTAGDFDMSVGGTMSLTAIMLAHLNVRLGVGIVPAVVIAVAVGILVGLINGLISVGFGISPLIVTLGMGTMLQGIASWISESTTITGVDSAISDFVIVTRLVGIPVAFYIGLVLAVAVWYLLTYTSLGRRMLYVGRGAEVARLSGVRVGRVRVGALALSSTFAALAGVLYVGTTSSAAPTAGAAFLLPAFAAVFLGATAISVGYYNAIGTVVAVYFLTTGITGLTQLGASSYVQDLFYGGALIAAVLLSSLSWRSVTRRVVSVTEGAEH